MAKKSPGMAGKHATARKPKKKPKQVLRPAQFSTRFAYQPAEDDSRPAAIHGPSAARTRFRSTVQALSSDYHYVASDLKRIAITAGALIVVMIILTFVVR